MVTGLSALLLGVVEGFTEFLPISSTAHLILASKLLGISQSGFAKTFEISIQSGAILAVLALYWRKFLDLETLKKVAVAFIPTGIIGLLLYKLVKDFLLESMGVVLLALGIGGALLILFEYLFERKLDKGSTAGAPDAAQHAESISYKKALGVGIFQSIAIIPGVSRAAATIIGGMLMGIKRETIVEFSFLLAVPTMLAATGLDLWKNAGAFSSSEMGVLAIGFVASFAMAIVGIKFLLRYIKRHTFTSFGIYRIVLALAFLLVIL
jgi:undecaprenyl-diphosphatase